MKSILSLLSLLVVLSLTGCNILDEDPNESQLPHAQPAGWEGTIPGMPTQGSGR